MTLTIEIPDALNQQFHQQQIPENEIESVVLAALEIWVAERKTQPDGRFAGSAEPFMRRLLAENRELFETLAQR